MLNAPQFQLVALLEHATRHLNSLPTVSSAASIAGAGARGGARAAFNPRLYLHGLLEDTLLALSHCEINCPDDSMLTAEVAPSEEGHWAVPDDVEAGAEHKEGEASVPLVNVSNGPSVFPLQTELEKEETSVAESTAKERAKEVRFCYVPLHFARILLTV